jgi:hypothetical protein
MLADQYDLSLSTTSSAARDAFVQGCDLALTLYPDALDAFESAIAVEEVGHLLDRRRPRAWRCRSRNSCCASTGGGRDSSAPALQEGKRCCGNTLRRVGAM